MTREEAEAFSAKMREAFRDNTDKQQSFLAGLAAGHIERLVAERDDFQRLFDLQWKRMAEATELWRAEKPDERALILPDLGDLLAWLMERKK